MRILHSFIFVLIALIITGCPLENERPPKQVAPIELPELPMSVIQVPLSLESRNLKRAFYQQFPNPLLEGETEEMKLKLKGKEKKEEDKNLLNRMTDPLLGWVDKTFQASAKLLYKVNLHSYDFWFDGDQFFSDIIMDLETEAKLMNGVTLFGTNAKLNGSLDCPMQVRMVLNGKIALTKDASIDITLNEEDAKIKFRKVCSSKTIQGLDMPKLFRPILEPLKKQISQSVNQMIASQLQSLLDSNSTYLSFKDKIDTAAQQLGQPYELLEEVWLVPQVQEVFVSPLNGVGKGFANKLEVSIGVKAKPEVVLSVDSPKVKIPNKVNFDVAEHEGETNIYVNAKVPLDYGANQLQTFLKAYVDENYSKYGYTIGKAELYPNQKRVVVAIDVLKAQSLKRKATIYLWGVPKYDSTAQEIYLDELAFTAKSKNVILKFAQWIMNPKIMKQLEANTRFSLSEKLKELQLQLSDFTIEQSMGTLTGQFDYVDISEVFVSKTDFEVYLQAKGKLDFDMKW